MIRLLLALMVCLFITGCGRDARALAASNADAGVQTAIQIAVERGMTDIVAILTGARKYIAPAADVPHSEWPAPTMTPVQIRANVPAYDGAAPPEPSGWGFVAALSTAGLGALWVIGRLAPMLPTFGPLAGKVADLGWSLLAHRDQKAADLALATTQSAAEAAKPVLAELRALPLESLPPSVRAALDSPLIGAALDHLTAPALAKGV